MEKIIDIHTLREFLDWAGASLYFKKHPFLTMRETLNINEVNGRTLEEWVKSYNEINSNGQGLMSGSDVGEDPIR